MPNSTIPNLPSFLGTPSGTEPMETVQSGLSVQIPSQKIADLATIVTPLTKTAMDALVSALQVSPYKLYLITNAVSNTRRLLVKGETTTTLEDTAIDMSTGEIGTYVLSTDIFTATSGGTPDLQQVTNVGFTTTNKLISDDGAGNLSVLNNGVIELTTGLQLVTIDAALVTTAYNVSFPDKLTGTETFAMLTDISSLVTSVTAGTNISVTGTSTAPIINSLSDRYSTSSVTSNTITNGAKTFTVDADLAYIPLQEVLIVNDPTHHMHATVTSYSGTTLVVDVKTHTGSGTFIVWVLNLDGVPVDAITGVGTANEIAYFTSGQVIASLAAGANGQVLGLSGGLPTWSTSKGAFGVTFDGQGGVVSVGKTDWVFIPYNCTITGWDITGDQVGSCVIDIWKDTYANFPPTAADSIAGSEKPTLASARTNIDLSLSPPWAAVTAGDCIMFYVESCSTLTKINLIVYTNIII